jgi:diguanylate cyclase (GGDEF)-like protein
LDVGNLPEGEQVQVTVSIGVAALGAPWDSGTQITDLLAAADRALYGAKRAGRDQVCVVTENAVVNSPAEVGRLGQV